MLSMLIAQAFFAAFCARADTVKQIEALQLVLPAGKNSIRVKRVPYASLKPDDAITIVSPHPKLNPKKLTNTWAGARIKKLLAPMSPRFGPEDMATVVGSDGYASQILARDLYDWGLIITHCDGKKIEWNKGGPQLMFPLSEPNVPAYMQNDSFWAWYNAAIMAGDLPPVVSLRQKGHEKAIDLAKLDFYKSEVTRRSYPPGKRLNEPTRREVKATFYDFKEFISHFHPEGSEPRLSLELFTGLKVDFKGKLDDYQLIFLWDDKPISHGFGGPVQLCPRGREVTQCTFFVRTIWID